MGCFLTDPALSHYRFRRRIRAFVYLLPAPLHFRRFDQVQSGNRRDNRLQRYRVHRRYVGSRQKEESKKGLIGGT